VSRRPSGSQLISSHEGVAAWEVFPEVAVDGDLVEEDVVLDTTKVDDAVRQSVLRRTKESTFSRLHTNIRSRRSLSPSLVVQIKLPDLIVPNVVAASIDIEAFLKASENDEFVTNVFHSRSSSTRRTIASVLDQLPVRIRSDKSCSQQENCSQRIHFSEKKESQVQGNS